MKVWVRLDGEAPGIGLGELLAIYESRLGTRPRIVGREGLSLVVDVGGGDDPIRFRLGDIGAFVKESGVLLWSGRQTEILNQHPRIVGPVPALVGGGSVKVDAEGFGEALNYRVCSSLGGVLKRELGVEINVRNPSYVVKAISLFSWAGVVLTKAKTTPKWASRELGLRPFKRPVMLKPKLARALVNLSRARAGSVLLDPFSGTGGVLIEAWVVGCLPVGVEIDHGMAAGSVTNLRWAGAREAGVIIGDSRVTPVARADSIASDLPYGRMSKTSGVAVEELLRAVVDQLPDLLPRGGYAALMVRERVREYEAEGARIAERYFYREHSALTRKILVYRVS